ncbi:hypothetical protein C8E95_2551 [Pseudonocardia autotrophica]|uniref:Uncharacterized protein n=1 Tax=Pseudonocardia autotrophica TaxID=2074 RepID=A0A1Y2N7V1_PSEAH|nr:hypothetical protein BG845_00498 [Pseudonocardia autotrophica]TDN73454.1 hypothetical protein C8E95_2551 [Pseudonocardia autotrophica]
MSAATVDIDRAEFLAALLEVAVAHLDGAERLMSR